MAPGLDADQVGSYTKHTKAVLTDNTDMFNSCVQLPGLICGFLVVSFC